jgi:hypothetical protein
MKKRNILKNAFVTAATFTLLLPLAPVTSHAATSELKEISLPAHLSAKTKEEAISFNTFDSAEKAYFHDTSAPLETLAHTTFKLKATVVGYTNAVSPWQKYLNPTGSVTHLNLALGQVFDANSNTLLKAAYTTDKGITYSLEATTDAYYTVASEYKTKLALPAKLLTAIRDVKNIIDNTYFFLYDCNMTVNADNSITKKTNGYGTSFFDLFNPYMSDKHHHFLGSSYFLDFIANDDADALSFDEAATFYIELHNQFEGIAATLPTTANEVAEIKKLENDLASVVKSPCETMNSTFVAGVGANENIYLPTTAPILSTTPFDELHSDYNIDNQALGNFTDRTHFITHNLTENGKDHYDELDCQWMTFNEQVDQLFDAIMGKIAK